MLFDFYESTSIEKFSRPFHDDRLRELGVIHMASFTGLGSQVIVLHGITILYSRFCKSENTRSRGILGRVGHESGQSGPIS